MPFRSEAQRGFMYANHPKLAKQYEKHTPEDADLPEHVKKMADGGLVNPYEVDQGDTSTIKGIPQPSPIPAMPLVPPATPTGPVFNPKAGIPPVQPLPASTTPSNGIQNQTQDDLAAFLAQQRTGMNKYGPDQQMAVEQDILNRRRGLGANLANAGAGLADALMQGVARAGPSNFQANLQNRMDKTDEGLRSAYQNAQAGKMAQMKQDMELSQMDPTSPLSRLAQRTSKPTLSGMGLSDDEISQMPASLISEATTKRLTLEEIRSKAEEARALHEQTAAYQGQMLKNTARGQAIQEKNETTGRKLEAAKGLSARPAYQKAIEMIPGMKSEATKAMQGQLTDSSYDPDVLSYAQEHGITPAQAQAQKDRRMAKP